MKDQLNFFSNGDVDSKLNTFAKCYKEFSLQKYLDLNLPKSLVKNLTKLRISAHTLLIEKGRYRRPKLPKDQRQCTVCTQIEDEEHFVLFCKKHDAIREKLFSKLNIDASTVTVNGELTSSIFRKIMNPEDKTETKEVCNYIQLAFSNMVT